MKERTRPALVSNLLNALASSVKATDGVDGSNASARPKVARPERRDFCYYKPLIDYETRQVVGHLADISLGGFKLDCQSAMPLNKDYRFLVNLTSEVADKPTMVFIGRSRWCRTDPVDPFIYNVGFQLIQISAEDLQIFRRMMEKYAREHVNVTVNLRRSNKW